MVNIRVHGSCGLIDPFRAFCHALAAAFGDLPHADDMDAVFLSALTALDQIGVIAGLGERNTLLMEDAHIFLAVGAGHVADLDHCRNSLIFSTIFSALWPSPKGW